MFIAWDSLGLKKKVLLTWLQTVGTVHKIKFTNALLYNVHGEQLMSIPTLPLTIFHCRPQVCRCPCFHANVIIRDTLLHVTTEQFVNQLKD